MSDKGDLTVTVRDGTGKVIIQGFVTQYSFSLGKAGPVKFDVSGIEVRSMMSPTKDKPQDTAPKKHVHEWIEYQGLIERYDYCKTCGKKQSEAK